MQQLFHSKTRNFQQEESKSLDFFPQKKIFLDSLTSQGKSKYKRYKGMPIRYAGGKSLAVGYIIELLPPIRRLVSPFFGGGSVEIAIAKELGIEVVGYDIFDVLVNYWQIQIKKPKELAKNISQWKPTKKQFLAIKERLKQHWKKEKHIKNKLELAAHYWYNHNLSYAPGFLGWMSSIYLDEKRYHRALGRVHNFHLKNISVNLGSFEKTILKHSEDFLYCDPPYYLGGDSKMFRGIYPQRNFPVHHNGFQHEKLAELLHKHKGGFILSYNDCEAVRSWYQDFSIQEVAWQYTLGQGETRIGLNRKNAGRNSNIKNSHELLIVKNAHISS